MRESIHHIKGPLLDQAAVCEPILRALPEWFGIEESIAGYVRDVASLPTFIACTAGHVTGFLTIKHHHAHVSEIHVMGVDPAFHRKGIGSRLVVRAVEHLLKRGTEYLLVKTLGPSRPDRHYAITRAFYEAMGFAPLEEMQNYWNHDNPCLLMIRVLDKHERAGQAH